MEKVILVGARLKNAPVEEDSLAELKRLTHTVGGTVLKTVKERLQAFNAATLIGRGKLEELALEAQALEADTVIFDDEISPAQAGQ